MPFTSLGLAPELLRAVAEEGYEQPTPIQLEAIPLALAGRDLIGSAQTGTGKTAAFMLPILQRLANAGPKHVLRALILVPTRELAEQVLQSARVYGRHVRGVTAAAVYGGVGMEPQTKALRHGADIIVATPGRLLDHMERGHVDFSRLEVLVLDEADRMLDMGFAPDVRRILAALPDQHRLALIGKRGEDAPHVGSEPHVEHLVGLVEHQHLEAGEVDVATLHVVEQPAGRRDDDIGAVSQRLGLGLHADAAVYRGRRHAADMASVDARALEHLLGELARGHQNQGPQHVFGTGVRQPLQDRQHEGGGLAGAGLRRADEIPACKRQRDRFQLDGGGLLVAFFGYRALQLWCKPEGCERHTILSERRHETTSREIVTRDRDSRSLVTPSRDVFLATSQRDGF